MSKVANFTQVLSPDGKAPSLPIFEEVEMPQGRIPTLGPRKRAANSLLRITDIAREVCMTVGEDHSGGNDVAQQISRILRERFAPDAINSTYPDVLKFTNIRRAGQTVGTYSMEFDMIREKAESRMARVAVSPINSRRPLACAVLHYPRMGNPWRWPVCALRWRPCRCQVKCDVDSDRAEARPDRMS